MKAHQRRMVAVVISFGLASRFAVEGVEFSNNLGGTEYVFEDRTDAYDASELECRIGASHPSGEDSSQLKNLDFEYWYAMGVTKTMGFSEMFQLEQILHAAVEDDMVWCWEEANDVVEAAGIQGGNRQLQTEKEARRRLFTEQLRNLGIISFTIGGQDLQTGYDCPNSVNDEMEASGATDCVVVRGEMRIVAHAMDDLSYAIAGLRDGLEIAMMQEGVGRKGEIPGLVFLMYLGDTADAVFGPDGTEGPGIGPGTIVDTTGGTANAARSADSGDDSLSIILGVGIPIVTAFVLAVFFTQKRRRAMTAAAYNSRMMNNSDFLLIGSGDPPNAFHEGLFHYLPSGQKYLSTQCEECLETRKNTFFSFSGASRDLASIPEDEEFHGDLLVRADSRKGLGQRTLGMNVHKCHSSTCRRCSPSLMANQQQTRFIGSTIYEDQVVDSDAYAHSLFSADEPLSEGHVEV